jgi:VCBS repeat-containing protein
LVFVGQVALAQLETVTDLNFGTGYIQPGQAQVTQKVTLVDSDDDNTDDITISEVRVENVLGTAVPTDFSKVEILDGNDSVKGSVSFPTSYPIIITIFNWTISDDSSDTLQVRVTVAPGVIGHRTIQTRVRISYTEGGIDYVAIADDGNATIINNPPVAANDASYSVNEDNTLTVAAPGVLGNDSDPDGDTLTAVLVSGPSHGTLTLNPNGSFTYTPAENFFGTDSFTYQAYDGVDYSNVATVTITVSSVNDAPVAEDDSYTTDEDTPLVVPAPGVLGNDSDVDGDRLTAVLVSGPSHGTLTLNEDGSFTYTPEENFCGEDSFTYKAYDGALYSNVATVTITVTPVNDAPVAEDDTYTANEDTPLVVPAPGVLGNDSDVEGDHLTAVLVSGPSHGTLTLNPNGSFTYTPAENFFGTDSFTYQAYDGVAYSNVATVTITVSSVNDAPVAEDDTYTANEDTPLVVPAPGVLGNDSDVEGDHLTAVLVSGPSHGTLTLNEDGSFTYTPEENFCGEDSFTYKAYDGALYSNVATVTITVSSVNDAPVAEDDSYTTDEDTPLVVPAPGVLGNDSDVEGDHLTAVLVSGPSHGTLTLNPNGSFTYTPAENFFGTDSFTYQAYDGVDYSNVATVTITVSSVNDAPVAEDDSYTTDEDTPLVVPAPGVLGNDSDVEGDPLTAVLVSGPSHGTLTLNPNGSFTYTPAGDYYGSDSFKYKARDRSGAESNEATVTITVNPVPYSARRTLPIGWNMISVPLKPIPPNNTPGAVFGDDITPLLIYRWNPNTNAYDANPSPIDPGHGYWVYIMTQDTEIDVDGTRIDFDYEVPLGKAGWHMISTPTVNVYWGYCKFTDGTTTKTYTEAIAADWIAPYIFRWDPATNSYTSYGASGVIEPWVGYWIRTYVDGLTLILPVYDAINSPPSPPTSLLVPSAAELGLTPPAPPVLPFTDKKTGFMVLNYPNPIRDVHTTKFMVLGAEVETIRVSIYDLSGRLVWRGEAPGNELTWHTDDLSGQFLANGVYLYIVEIKVGGQWIRTDVKKLVILR